MRQISLFPAPPPKRDVLGFFVKLTFYTAIFLGIAYFLLLAYMQYKLGYG